MDRDYAEDARGELPLLQCGVCAEDLFQGDVFQLFIPSELAYGDTPRGNHIKAGDVLIFDLELIKINGASKDTSKDEL
jgi:hypothetical protein